MSDAGSAAFRVSGMELGGLFGSLLAGRISDHLIAKNPKGGNVGKRVQVLSQLYCNIPIRNFSPNAESQLPKLP